MVCRGPAEGRQPGLSPFISQGHYQEQHSSSQGEAQAAGTDGHRTMNHIYPLRHWPRTNDHFQIQAVYYTSEGVSSLGPSPAYQKGQHRNKRGRMTVTQAEVLCCWRAHSGLHQAAEYSAGLSRAHQNLIKTPRGGKQVSGRCPPRSRSSHLLGESRGVLPRLRIAMLQPSPAWPTCQGVYSTHDNDQSRLWFRTPRIV